MLPPRISTLAMMWSAGHSRSQNCSALQVVSTFDFPALTQWSVYVHKWSTSGSWRGSFPCQIRQCPPLSNCWLFKKRGGEGDREGYFGGQTVMFHIMIALNNFNDLHFCFLIAFGLMDHGSASVLVPEGQSSSEILSQSGRHKIQLVEYHSVSLHVLLEATLRRVVSPPPACWKRRCHQLVCKWCHGKQLDVLRTCTDIIRTYVHLCLRRVQHPCKHGEALLDI